MVSDKLEIDTKHTIANWKILSMRFNIMSQPQKIFLYTVALTSILTTPFAVFAIRILDPINATAPVEVIARVIQGFLAIVGAFALLNFTIAGLGLITSRGNEEKVRKHRENLTWTVIGIALLFGSYAIISYVLDKLSGVTGVGG